MPTRDSAVQVRVTKTEAEQAKRVAKSRDVSVAEAIRQLIDEADQGITRGETHATTPGTRREST
jgi:hypothetical protein